MIKAYGYLRVSGTGQVEGDGFDRQQELISRFADQAGIIIPRFYEERGVSGAKGEEDRPAFQEMLTAILSNGVRAVIVERLDRLAREYVVQEQLLVYLAAKGITLWNASTGENVTEAVKADPMKKAVIQIQGVFAELEKSLLVNRLAKARERKRAENGKCEGAKGWNEIAPERKAEILKVVRIMRRKPRNGGRPHSYQAIADHLNAAEMRPSAQGRGVVSPACQGVSLPGAGGLSSGQLWQTGCFRKTILPELFRGNVNLSVQPNRNAVIKGNAAEDFFVLQRSEARKI
jgi:site-specific DNA recombinase